MTEYVPAGKAGTIVATPLESRLAVPITLPALAKVTVPVGTGPELERVVEMSTVCGVLPPTEDMVRFVEVGIAVIVSERLDELLAASFKSPE
jgi:hypothetical protein